MGANVTDVLLCVHDRTIVWHSAKRQGEDKVLRITH